ncbi:MAG: molybdopterin-dependent oxidoreductase, partial [Serratia liquefaciens]|nr:molybdopterin-dependent oxidoreductase [Serratia liquefaciens]
MSIKRYPQLAHWGAYTAVVEDGRLIRCEPFADDPDPSPILDSIAPMAYSDKRIRKPSVRRSWLQKREGSDRTLRGREDFVEVDWDLALDLVAEENRRVRDRYGPSGLFTGSYGWSSAGRLHHARSLVRRFYFAGGGGVDQLGNYSWGAAQFFLPYVIGTFTPLTGRVTSWPSVVEHCELFVAFGGLALKNAQVSSGGAAEHSLKPWLQKLVKKGTPVINISPMRDDCPEFVNAEWIPIRPNTDVALMLALAYEIQRRGAQDEAFLYSHCTGYSQLADYLRGTDDGVA